MEVAMVEIIELTPLIASNLALVAGPVVYWAFQRTRPLLVTLHLGLVAAVTGLLLLDVLPECLETVGFTALLAAGLGLLGPVLAERGLRGGKSGGFLLVLAFIAILLHAFTDGVALVAGHDHGHGHGHAEAHGHGLSLWAAVALHRLPEGAALWWLLRPRGRERALAGLTAVAAATTLGFVLGESALPVLDGNKLALFQAFVAGVLLHVVVHHYRAPQLEAAHALR
jgi:zinc transporter ZupT